MDREKVIKKLTVRIQSDSEEWNTIELPIEEAKEILALLKEQADRMMDEKKDEIQDLIDCAYKNIGNAKSANDGMTAVACMLGSIAHSLAAIAVMMRDNDDK